MALGGIGTSVHSSSVGKYGILFSSVLALRAMQRWMKSEHFLLELEWLVESQLMHLTSFSEGQSGILWLPAHVPQVSLSALHDRAMWPHC